MATNQALPSNPFHRQPVRKGWYLAGREAEVRRIEYYFGITASGGSPHIALIGPRGVGKTSLLNAAEASAVENHLLPLRIDMNEDKARSAGRFWHDLYSALCLAAVRVGCWGGLQGSIYTNLFTMMHARRVADTPMAVLQFPFALACHQGSLDELQCPDALIVADLEATLEELSRHRHSGIAFLIDEGDCLGSNRGLLQIFRNIFQRVERCTLLLAGTEAIFPAVSEIFSPIPRQFYRVDVQPFSHWTATWDLIAQPIYRAFPQHLKHSTILPTRATARELHELCGGDPSELQLYSHYMYKQVQDGESPRMELTPKVFRDILGEYRASTPSNLGSVLSAIEQLPDSLMYKSSWLSYRKLTSEQNLLLEVLRRELRHGRSLSEDEASEATHEVLNSFKDLHKAGITDDEKQLRVIGAPLSSSFWKSFVKVRKGKRWSWNDDSFETLKVRVVINSVSASTKALHLSPFRNDTDAATALNDLRSKVRVKEIDRDSVADLMMATIMGRETERDILVDALITVDVGSSAQVFRLVYFGDVDFNVITSQVLKWIGERESILSKQGVVVKLDGVRSWKLPSNEELHRLAWIAGFTGLPEEDFGPDLREQAITKFSEGDIEGSTRLFSQMIADRDESDTRNNLAYCLIIDGKYNDAEMHLRRALDMSYTPFIGHNFGLTQLLQGDKNAAANELRKALSWMRRRSGSYDQGSVCMLILDREGRHVSSKDAVPVNASILLNLFLMGEMSAADLTAELRQLYPDEFPKWLSLAGVSP